MARESDGLGGGAGGGEPFALPDPEKEQVKAHITDLMLCAPPRVRAQLSEALSIISAHDFPARWQGLLPHLIEKLSTDDMQLMNGVLTTADSIYQRYRRVPVSVCCVWVGGVGVVCDGRGRGGGRQGLVFGGR